MLCCQGSNMSVYRSTFTKHNMLLNGQHFIEKKGPVSYKLATYLPWGHMVAKKTSLPSHACWRTVGQQSAYIMLIVPIMPAKDLGCSGISSVPTCCVYLLPTRNQQLVRVCFWTSELDCLLMIADLHVQHLCVSHDPHTPDKPSHVR